VNGVLLKVKVYLVCHGMRTLMTDDRGGVHQAGSSPLPGEPVAVNWPGAVPTRAHFMQNDVAPAVSNIHRHGKGGPPARRSSS